MYIRMSLSPIMIYFVTVYKHCGENKREGVSTQYDITVMQRRITMHVTRTGIC